MTDTRSRIVRALRSWLPVLAAGVLASCASSNRTQTRTFIFGFGIVTFTNGSGAAVQDTRGLGLVLDDGVSLGLIRRHRVEIDPRVASNIVVSISANPFALSISNFHVADPYSLVSTTQTNHSANP